MTFRSLKAGIRGLFRRADVDREVDAELAHYLEESTREHIGAGMSPRDAERAARALASAADQGLVR